jgi:hypothetical protein
MCKRNMKTCRILQAELEVEVSNHAAWRAKVKERIKSAKDKENWREKKREPADIRGHSLSLLLTPPPSSDYNCSKCKSS